MCSIILAKSVNLFVFFDTLISYTFWILRTLLRVQEKSVAGLNSWMTGAFLVIITSEVPNLDQINFVTCIY